MRDERWEMREKKEEIYNLRRTRNQYVSTLLNFPQRSLSFLPSQGSQLAEYHIVAIWLKIGPPLPPSESTKQYRQWLFIISCCESRAWLNRVSIMETRSSYHGRDNRQQLTYWTVSTTSHCSVWEWHPYPPTTLGLEYWPSTSMRLRTCDCVFTQ